MVAAALKKLRSVKRRQPEILPGRTEKSTKLI